MTYDLENFCADVKKLLTDNLNTKLLALDTEKNDGLTLKPVASDAYFFQELNEATVNYDPYVLYSIENIESVGIGPATSARVTLHVVVVLADQNTESIAARMLRYQRALKEVFETKWTENQNGVKLSISSFAPVQFTLLNSAFSYRAIGVALTGDIS